jgi:phosphinothricin acetyltransferase
VAHIDVRRAIAGDGEAIARIYNHYVLTSTATFDTEPKTPADREAWLANRSPAHPVLVAEQDGRVVGWGSLSPWGERPAYRHSVEISTYVDFESISLGVGPALAEALIGDARSLGHHAVLSRIVADNEPSLKMSARLGFVEVGRLREVGRKCGRWLDLVICELVLEPLDDGDDS